MLEKYFTMDVSEDGRLCSIPMLLKDYVPTLDRLPLFLLRLGTEVSSNGFSLYGLCIAKPEDLRWTGKQNLNASSHWQEKLQYSTVHLHRQSLRQPQTKMWICTNKNMIDIGGRCSIWYFLGWKRSSLPPNPCRKLRMVASTSYPSLVFLNCIKFSKDVEFFLPWKQVYISTVNEIYYRLCCIIGLLSSAGIASARSFSRGNETWSINGFQYQ